MKVTYRIEANPLESSTVTVDVNDFDRIEIGGVWVDVECDPDSRQLIAVDLTIPEQAIRRDPDSNAIVTVTTESESRAFSAASYVANVLRIETGADLIDPYQVVNSSPRIIPENQDEEREIAGSLSQVVASRNVLWSVRRNLSATDWQRWKDVASSQQALTAVAHYADGLGITSPFAKYEQFFKVFEVFFPDLRGKKLDGAVSKHLTTYDESITLDMFTFHRELRIRSVHAEPHKGSRHLSSHRFDDILTLTAALPQLQRLAWLMLQHPPT